MRVRTIDVECDDRWLELTLELDFLSLAGRVMIVDGDRLGVYDLWRTEFDWCGFRETDTLVLELEQISLGGGQGYGCTDFEPTPSVTFIAWVLDLPGGDVGDCVAWGPSAASIIAGEHDDALGSEGPPDGFSQCREAVPEPR